MEFRTYFDFDWYMQSCLLLFKRFYDHFAFPIIILISIGKHFAYDSQVHLS